MELEPATPISMMSPCLITRSRVFALAETLAERGPGAPNPCAGRAAVETWFDALATVARAKLDAEQEP